MALRAVFADSDCQCSMVLYHDHVELALQEQGYSLPNPCKDTAELRSEARNAFRSALWTCKVTFRENDYLPADTGVGVSPSDAFPSTRTART